MISHVKTGMYDISDRSFDQFEEYMSTWNIQGARFTDGDWTMNPDGFVKEPSKRGAEILKAAKKDGRFLNAGEKTDHPYFLLEQRWGSLYGLFATEIPGTPEAENKARVYYHK